MDKYEYEQTFGERLIHCPIHNISGIDGCIACDEEEQEVKGEIEMVAQCATCGYSSSEDEFMSVSGWAALKLTGQSGLVCQTCYEGYTQHQQNIADADRKLTDLINTDYLD